MMPVLAELIEELERLDSVSVWALYEIARERVRQINMEGWTPQHDDAHQRGEMAQAAGCYALHAALDNTPENRALPAPVQWPWAPEWWKPKSPVKDYHRAGALLVAELARWHRQPKPVVRDDDRSAR